MNSRPETTVVMAAHNAEKFLRESVDSILSQTYADFELLVVDDASTDSTPEILAQYSDPRVRVLRNHVQLERCASRNRGLTEARGSLVAILDSDDVSLPMRLEVETAFLRKHQEVTVCGSYYEIYETGLVEKPPVNSESIRARLLFENPLAHSSTMFHRAAVLNLTGGYDPISPYAEDYNLWVSLARHRAVGFANIPETLCRYRVHPDSVSRVIHSINQDRQVDRARVRLLDHLLGGVSEEEVQCHLALACMPVFSLAIVPHCLRWPERLMAANAQTGVFDPAALDAELRYRIDRLPKELLKAMLPNRAYSRVLKWRFQRLFSRLWAG